MRWHLAIVALLAARLLCTTTVETNSTPVRCGTEEPPADLLVMAKTMSNVASTRNAVAADQALEIGLYIHVVTTEDKEGTVTNEMISDQVHSSRSFSTIHLTVQHWREADH